MNTELWSGRAAADPLHEPSVAPLRDAELDRLFAEPQRPRWKVGAGAVVVLALLACAIVVFAIALQPRANDLPALADLDTSASPVAQPSESGTVLVHVAGEVHKPGVYELAVGDRVIDALTAAGGVTEHADPNALNYARTLSDGEQIYVPKPGEASPAGQDAPGQQPGGGSSAAGLININTATATELETLPRIGPAMAQRIIDYRNQHGGFNSIEELKNVSGIGDATFAGLKELVTV